MLLHNTTIAQPLLDTLEGTVGDHMGLFPIAYLARARRRGPSNPSSAVDFRVARTTVERYILEFPHRVPSGLPAAGTFARTGGDPRENATGAATFLWGDDQFMGLTLMSRFASGQELDRSTRRNYADLAAKMQIGEPSHFTKKWMCLIFTRVPAGLCLDPPTAAFSEQMRDSVDGLYSHGVNVATGHHSCCKWGRANGWGMLSHIEVLSALSVSMGNSNPDKFFIPSYQQTLCTTSLLNVGN